MLKVKHLHKFYHNFAHKPLHVINDTSLEIPETGIIAVIGASGAGKTTLINTISGLDSFKSGTIEFDDTKMNHYRTSVADRMRMKNYGFIFQNYYLLEKQTVYENVKVSLDAFDISEEEKKKRVNYVLSQLGIAKYTNKVVSSLSGGEQQRVSIARALVKSPRIIFADEPTGSLDEITTFNVLNIFKQISKNCAVFIVTHERDIISYYADYIIEIENGIVVKEFSPKLDNDKTLSIDQNIYLDELEHLDHHENENLSIDLYSDDSSKEKVDVKVAVRNGKIYLESSQNIKVLDAKSENHLIKGKRKNIQDYVKKDFDYSLEPLTYSKNTIGAKEVFKKGYQNFKSKGKTKMVLKIMCLALSVLSIGLLEGFSTIESFDLSKDLRNSEGNLYLNITPDSMNIKTSQLNIAYQEVCKEIVSSNLEGDILFDSSDPLVYHYEGFTQLQSQMFTISSFDLKDVKSLNENELVYGSLPKNGYEIVVDEYVLENFIHGTVLKNIVNNYSYFIGKSFDSNTKNYSLTISGITRKKSPTIYGDQGLTFARLSNTDHMRIIDFEYAKTLYPELTSYYIYPGHCLRNEKYNHNPLPSMIVDGYFSSIPYDIIVNKNDYPTVKVEIAATRSKMYIQTDGNKETMNSFAALVKQVEKSLSDQGIAVKIEVQHLYQIQKDNAMANLNNILSTVTIVAYVVLGLALILIILSTYLSMLNQISDIAVYRSLGYSRSFLGMIYLTELALLAFIYSIIGGLGAYFVMFIMDLVPLVSYSIATPFGLIALAILALALGITIIGILPVMFVFRLTPASIYSRYNRKINNE